MTEEELEFRMVRYLLFGVEPNAPITIDLDVD